MVQVRRKPEGVQRGERRAGVREFRLRPPAEEVFTAPPAAVRMLDGEKVLKCLLKSRIVRVPQDAERPGRVRGVAGVYRTARRGPEPPVLPLRAENERGGVLEHRLRRLHAQLPQKVRRLQRRKRAALMELPVGRGPEVCAVIVPPCKDRLNVGFVEIPRHIHASPPSRADGLLFLHDTTVFAKKKDMLPQRKHAFQVRAPPENPKGFQALEDPCPCVEKPQL